MARSEAEGAVRTAMTEAERLRTVMQASQGELDRVTRIVCRRFSEASAITAPAFHPFAAVFHCKVVPEASTSAQRRVPRTSSTKRMAMPETAMYMPKALRCPIIAAWRSTSRERRASPWAVSVSQPPMVPGQSRARL